MVSLVIPPKDDINRINKLLTGELGTAANIKSRVTRQSVLTAITSTRESKFTYTPNHSLRTEALQVDSLKRISALLWSYSHGRWKNREKS